MLYNVNFSKGAAFLCTQLGLNHLASPFLDVFQNVFDSCVGKSSGNIREDVKYGEVPISYDEKTRRYIQGGMEIITQIVFTRYVFGSSLSWTKGITVCMLSLPCGLNAIGTSCTTRVVRAVWGAVMRGTSFSISKAIGLYVIGSYAYQVSSQCKKKELRVGYLEVSIFPWLGQLYLTTNYGAVMANTLSYALSAVTAYGVARCILSGMRAGWIAMGLLSPPSLLLACSGVFLLQAEALLISAVAKRSLVFACQATGVVLGSALVFAGGVGGAIAEIGFLEKWVFPKIVKSWVNKIEVIKEIMDAVESYAR